MAEQVGSRRALEWLATHLGPPLIRALGATLRIRKKGTEHLDRARRIGGGRILVFWHGRLLALTYIHRNQGIRVLVSTHRDGEYIARVIHGLGFGTVRGSSTRGGRRALMEMLSAGRNGPDIGITPDGPRGPSRQCRPGAVYVAKRSSRAVVPIGVSARPALTLGSWDSFLIPLPFARVSVVYGEPVVYDEGVEEEQLKSAALDLGRRLEQVTLEADHDSGRLGP
jgi:hypothetical protein